VYAVLPCDGEIQLIKNPYRAARASAAALKLHRTRRRKQRNGSGGGGGATISRNRFIDAPS